MPENATNIVVADEAPAAATPPLHREEVGATRPTGDEVDLTCPNCGEKFRSPFCPNCGEQKVAGKDYSLRHFLHEAFNILTSVESNLFRSFAALLIRPGRLTVEYFKGRRKSYLKPLQLFIFCNIIFFFAHSYVSFNTLTTPLYVHLNMLPHQRLARHMIDSELRARNMTYDDYRPRFDAALEEQAKTLVIVMVPLYALALQLFYWRTRRFYVEHLVFSLHFYAFLLLLIAGMHAALFVGWRARHLFGANLSLLQHDGFVSLVMLLLCGTYLYFALRRVYGQGKLLTALKCLVLAVGIFGVIHVYRFILFFTTFYAI
jgi:hypothetical protein